MLMQLMGVSAEFNRSQEEKDQKSNGKGRLSIHFSSSFFRSSLLRQQEPAHLTEQRG
jgi:hypothetical protein